MDRARDVAGVAGFDEPRVRIRGEQVVHVTVQHVGGCQRVAHMRRIPQPIIARVHGIATAAGCQLVSMCDLAVASDTARFALPGVNVGLFCSTPAVGVVRNIGRKRSMELLLTGELIDASTALSWGLVNRVVPAAALDAEVARLASIILARSGKVVATGKRTFYRQIDQPLDPAYATTTESMVSSLLEPDAAEGIDAFIEKRPAQWPVDETGARE